MSQQASRGRRCCSRPSVRTLHLLRALDIPPHPIQDTEAFEAGRLPAGDEAGRLPGSTAFAAASPRRRERFLPATDTTGSHNSRQYHGNLASVASDRTYVAVVSSFLLLSHATFMLLSSSRHWPAGYPSRVARKLGCSSWPMYLLFNAAILRPATGLTVAVLPNVHSFPVARAERQNGGSMAAA